MSLTASILSIASRGELKVGFMILTISLFTGLVVAVEAMAQSYARESAALREISRMAEVKVDTRPMGGAVRVYASTLDLEGRTLMILASEDPGSLINLEGARVEGGLPGDGELLVGLGLRPLVGEGVLKIMGLPLRVSGYISSPAHLASSIITTPETLRKMGLEATTLYYAKAPAGAEGVPMAEAPSSSSLVGAVTGEALSTLSILGHILTAMLAVTCGVQGYNSSQEGGRAFRVYSALGASRRMMACSLIILSLTLSLAGVTLGYALGLAGSAIISSTLSLALGLPYVKSLAGVELLRWLGTSYALSSTALSIGLLKGYRVDGV
jgi:hypothetical protein